MGRDRGPGDTEAEPSDDETEDVVRPSPVSSSRADGPPHDPYADSPGASLDSDEPVEPNEPA